MKASFLVGKWLKKVRLDTSAAAAICSTVIFCTGRVRASSRAARWMSWRVRRVRAEWQEDLDTDHILHSVQKVHKVHKCGIGPRAGTGRLLPSPSARAGARPLTLVASPAPSLTSDPAGAGASRPELATPTGRALGGLLCPADRTHAVSFARR